MHSTSPVTTSDDPIRTLIGFLLLPPNKVPTAAVNMNVTALHAGTVMLSAAVERNNESIRLFGFYGMNYFTDGTYALMLVACRTAMILPGLPSMVNLPSYCKGAEQVQKLLTASLVVEDTFYHLKAAQQYRDG